MNPRDILLIVNPISGRMKSKAGLFEILDELYRVDRPSESEEDYRLPFSEAEAAGRAAPEGAAYGTVTPNTLGGENDPGRRVTVLPTMFRGHATRATVRADLDGYDTVICCGGDGTLNETISGLLSIPPEHRPALGYIPAGSTNDFAASLGLPTSLRGAARVAVSDREAPIDIGAFIPLGEGQLPSRNFSYIASFGIFTAASYSTPQATKNVLGHVAYLLEGVKDLANIQSHHAAFTLAGGTRVEGDYIFGAVTNTTSAGGVFKLPAGSVSMSDGEFEVFLVHTPHTLAELNRIVTALMSGRLEDCPLIEFHHTPEATVELEQPLSWSLDGEEALGGTRIEIRCLPGAVRLKLK